MLEQLFGSRTRVKLLRLLLANPDKAFYVRELTRLLEEQINSIRRELANLEKIGLVSSETKNLKKYFQVNKDFLLFTELRSLILKSRFVVEKKFLNSIQKTGQIQQLILCGQFVNEEDAPVDLLIVGRINKEKLDNLLDKFSDNFSQKLRFTTMDLKEYNYRKDVTDKFLYDILNRKKIIVLDKLK